MVHLEAGQTTELTVEMVVERIVAEPYRGCGSTDEKVVSSHG